MKPTASQIAHCTNNHEKLVELLESALSCMVIGINDYSIADKETIDRGYRLLAELSKAKDSSD